MTANAPRYPLSRRQAVDRLPADGVAVVVEASPAECEGLAAIYGIPAVERVRAELRVRPWRRTGVKVTGTVVADVVQECVVSLDPVPEHVEEDVAATFLPEEEIAPEDDADEIEIRADAEDPPEPFDGRAIDLGAIVAEHVAIGLDPYPRAPGAVFEPHIEDDPEADAPPSPFAALGGLKPRESE